jgi:osmotically-inducible protein OsmY
MIIQMMRVISILLIALLSVPLLGAQTGKNDDRIYNDVRSKLADDPDIKGAAIEVTVSNGVVTLKGRVADALARDKATKVAKKAKGVTMVDNQLKLFSEN